MSTLTAAIKFRGMALSHLMQSRCISSCCSTGVLHQTLLQESLAPAWALGTQPCGVFQSHAITHGDPQAPPASPTLHASCLTRTGRKWKITEWEVATLAQTLWAAPESSAHCVLRSLAWMWASLCSVVSFAGFWLGHSFSASSTSSPLNNLTRTIPAPFT